MLYFCFVSAKYTVTGKGKSLTGKSVLKLSLSRGDILATFKCQVESEALDEPIIHSITTDVHGTYFFLVVFVYFL